MKVTQATTLKQLLPPRIEGCPLPEATDPSAQNRHARVVRAAFVDVHGDDHKNPLRLPFVKQGQGRANANDAFAPGRRGITTHLRQPGAYPGSLNVVVKKKGREAWYSHYMSDLPGRARVRPARRMTNTICLPPLLR